MFAIFILKNHPVSIIQDAGLASVPVCTFPRRKDSLASGENRTPDFLLPNLHGIRGVFAGTPVSYWAVPNSKVARGAGHNGRFLMLPLIASRQMVGNCLKM